MIKASYIVIFFGMVWEYFLTSAENREAAQANISCFSTKGGAKQRPEMDMTSRGPEPGRAEVVLVRPLALCYCRFSLFQPNYVGIICVNFSPKSLIERKAEVTR